MKKKYGVSILLAWLTAMVISLSGAYADGVSMLDVLGREMYGISFDKFIIFIGLAIFYEKSWDTFRKSRSWITHLIAVIFSACMLIGISYSVQGSWAFIMGSKYQIVIAAFSFAGYFILFDVALSVLYCWLDKRNICRTGRTEASFSKFIENHYFLFCFLVIYLCWLPFIIIFFPGSVPADGYRQLDMFVGGETFTTRHAWVLTMFVGALMQLGRTVSDNAGVFLVILVTSIIEDLCFSYACTRVRKWKAPKSFCIECLLYFALVPSFGAYAQTLIKDSTFCGVFVLFMVLYVDCAIPALRKQRTQREIRKQLIFLMIAGMLVCVCRNNGVYLVFPAMILLIFLMSKKQMILILVLSLTIFGGHRVSEKVIAPSLGIKPISTRVYFTIPFQQTARYLATYPDDVTKEEKKAINAVLNYDKLAQRYNPELSDPVKATYRGDTVTKENLENYFRAWFSMFKKHPGVYVEATLHNTYGYYYPFYTCTAQHSFKTYMKKSDHYVFNYKYVMPKEWRKAMIRYAYFWEKVPGLSQITNAGTYTWLLIILAGYLIHRKRWKGILAMAAPFLNVAVCIASPVNGLYRYVYPMAACIFFMIYWCLEYGEKEFTGEDS